MRTTRAARLLATLPMVAAALLSQDAGAQTRVVLEGWVWQGALTAAARVSDGELGTDLDFQRDLGLADEDIPEGRLVVALGRRHRLRAGFLEVGYRGDDTVSRTVEFNGRSYTAGARVVTDLSKRYGRFGWIWQPLQSRGGGVRLGTVIELKSLSVEATLAAPELAPPVRESESFDGVLPTAGLALDLAPHPAVALFFEVSGLDAGDTGSLLDAEAGLRVAIGRHLGVHASYRILDLHFEDEADYADLEIEGPLVGISVRF